ncbi:MAG: cysteine desulfurase-like protein [Solirubrobacterales bacterium]
MPTPSELVLPNGLADDHAEKRSLPGMNRKRFPGLRDGWARLDGPAGTQMLDTAIEATAEFSRSGRNANHGGLFAAAQATDATVVEAREAVGRLLGADPRGVAFGPSMTALTMRFAAAAGRTLAPGDEIVCTRLDHDANVRPWVIAAARAEAAVRFAEPARDTLELPASAIEAVLTDRTRWVAIPAASNAVGTIPDVAAIVAAAKRAGARVFVDAVHAAPHRPLSVHGIGADVLACSAYKWFGPHIGILAADPALLEELQPDKLVPSPDSAPDRWELGTLPFEALAAVAEAARYLARLAWDAVRAHEDVLLSRALEGLGELDGVSLYGAARDRTPTLMFNVDGLTSAQTATALAERQVAVWHGNYYAWELERFLGLDPDGAVRAGFVHYNDESDADRLVQAVAELVNLPARSAG